MTHCRSEILCYLIFMVLLYYVQVVHLSRRFFRNIGDKDRIGSFAIEFKGFYVETHESVLENSEHCLIFCLDDGRVRMWLFDIFNGIYIYLVHSFIVRNIVQLVINDLHQIQSRLRIDIQKLLDGSLNVCGLQNVVVDLTESITLDINGIVVA